MRKINFAISIEFLKVECAHLKVTNMESHTIEVGEKNSFFIFVYLRCPLTFLPSEGETSNEARMIWGLGRVEKSKNEICL